MARKLIKADDLGVSVAKDPSLMTGAIPRRPWMDTPAVFKPGNYAYPTKKSILEYHKCPNPRDWNPEEEDWKLPDNWQEILLRGLKERLDKSGRFRRPIVTEIKPAGPFWRAEDYHQRYHEKHGGSCAI